MLETPGTWTLSAKCAGMGDEFFGDTEAEQKMVRRFCTDCPVRRDCLKEALVNRIEWGVWGGFTERERRRMLRQRVLIAS